MSNYHFKEKGMSLKAKGLLSQMLSLPDDWDYSINGLVALSKDGKGSVVSALKELEEFGYLTREMTKSDNGKFNGIVYNIFEAPQAGKPSPDKPRTEKPFAENRHAEIPLAENQPQLNTKGIKLLNESSTNEWEETPKGVKKSREKRPLKLGRYGNVPFNEEELAVLKQEYPSDWQERIDRVSEYCESTGKTYKSGIATVRSWARKDGNQDSKPTARSQPRQSDLASMCCGFWKMTPADYVFCSEQTYRTKGYEYARAYCSHRWDGKTLRPDQCQDVNPADYPNNPWK